VALSRCWASSALADAGSGDAPPAALLRDGRRLQLQLARAF
jgi:hypothetical protein